MQAAPVLERIGKTGKPWAKFVVEDFSGAKEFVLFGEDFSKFRSFLQVNAMIFAQGSIRSRYHDENELEFKFGKISYLADLKASLLKSLHLQLKLEQITQETLTGLMELSKKNKGAAALKVSVQDTESEYVTELFSRKVKLDWNLNVRSELERLQIAYKIN